MYKIKDFIDKFTIEPSKDIEPFFKKIKELDIDVRDFKHCFNCGDTINHKQLPSSPWSSVQYCWKCKTLSVVYHQDRMGGAFTDKVYIFKEKNNGDN